MTTTSLDRLIRLAETTLSELREAAEELRQQQEAEPVKGELLEARPDPEELMEERDAAALLGLSVKTLQNLRWQGGGPPYFKVGGRRKVRYRRDDLNNWLTASRRTSTSDPGSVAR